jgi:acyl-CoA hydrolase
MAILYRTRKVVKPGDLNSRNTLFGGRLLEWIDEECGHSTITVECHVRIKRTQQEIVSIDEVVFVNVDDNGRPTRHGKYAEWKAKRQ